MAYLSSMGHWLVGWFVLAVAFLVALEAAGLRRKVWRFAIPSMIIGSGLALVLFVVFHAGFNRAHEMLSYALSDRQQTQHFIIAGATVLIGLAEARARSVSLYISSWRFVWPIAYIGFGLGLILHEQAGPHAQAIWRYHVLLGVIVMSAGAARLMQVSRRGWFTPAGYIFALLLAIEALMLLAFRSPIATQTNLTAW